MSSPVAFNWNVFPSTKLEANQMLTPLGCIYSPLHPSKLQTTSEALQCSMCRNYINQFIRLDRPNNRWWCPFCGKTTKFPSSFTLPEKQGANDQIPPEIRPSTHGTCEYILPNDISTSKSGAPCVVALVVDQYQHTESLLSKEFDILKQTIADSVDKLPKDTVVLLITFSDIVEIHSPQSGSSTVFTQRELFGDKYNYSKLFKDDKLKSKIISKLNLKGLASVPLDSLLVSNGFLQPPNAALSTYIMGLRPKLTSSFKPPRASGLALFIATSLLSNHSFRNLAGKVCFFASGPATMNPGMIVAETEPIRSHHDVANLSAPRFKDATRFYQTLAYMSVGYQAEEAYNAVYSSSGKLTDYSVQEFKPKFTFDIYTGSLDQVGVYEMKHLAQAGSGNIALADSFASQQFKLQFEKNMSELLTNKVRAKLAITASRGVKIMKAVGHGTELQSSYQSEKYTDYHHEKISDLVTKFDSSLKKRNFTNQWSLGNISEHDAIAFYFEVETASSASRLNATTGVKDVYIQFQTQYWDVETKKTILRVTTIKKETTLSVLAANQVKLSSGHFKLLNTKSLIMKEKAFVEGFDHLAWMVLFTRLLISKIDTTIGFESFEEVVNDVDSALIRMMKFFGGADVSSKSSDNPLDSVDLIYSINGNFKDLPSYSYNLRRNPQLARIFNSSPDETASYHHLFVAADIPTSCVMISPVLYKVVEGELKAVLLDVTSLNEGPGYYVLDSVFNVIIYHQFSSPQAKLALHNSNNEDFLYGDTRNSEELKLVLELVNTELLAGRSVCSKIVLTQSGHSQARFLMARLNPVTDHEETKTESSSWWWMLGRKPTNDMLMTDDVSVGKYYDELLERVKNFKIESDY